MRTRGFVAGVVSMARMYHGPSRSFTIDWAQKRSVVVVGPDPDVGVPGVVRPVLDELDVKVDVGVGVHPELLVPVSLLDEGVHHLLQVLQGHGFPPGGGSVPQIAVELHSQHTLIRLVTTAGPGSNLVSFLIAFRMRSHSLTYLTTSLSRYVSSFDGSFVGSNVM